MTETRSLQEARFQCAVRNWVTYGRNSYEPRTQDCKNDTSIRVLRNILHLLYHEDRWSSLDVGQTPVIPDIDDPDQRPIYGY